MYHGSPLSINSYTISSFPDNREICAYGVYVASEEAMDVTCFAGENTTVDNGRFSLISPVLVDRFSATRRINICGAIHCAHRHREFRVR